jgi:hypothetical protein
MSMGFAVASEYPIRRVVEPRTIRLVSTANLRGPVLAPLVDSKTSLSDLEELEGATSGRLNMQSKGTDKLDPKELAAGVAHAHFINAAFAYWRPKTLNRFNGPSRGAWYAALELETCVSEIVYHVTRELENIRNFHTAVECIEMYASLAGEYIDLRGLESEPLCLHPDPSIGYPHGNELASEVLAHGQNGIIYPSVRHPKGTCFAALRPQAVQSVTQGSIIRLSWKGKPKPSFQFAKP